MGGLDPILEVNEEVPIDVQLHLTKIDFTGNNEVFKFGNSVFLIGSLDLNYLTSNKFCINFLYNIFSLLDRGNKFVPCYFVNNFYFFSNIINIYNNFSEKLNKKIYFSNKDCEINKDFLYLTRDNVNIINKNKSFINVNYDFSKIDDNFIEHLSKNFPKKDTCTSF